MPTIPEIHRVAYQSRNPDWQSHLNCGAINTELRDALNDAFGLIADLSIGELLSKPRHVHGAEHAWVYIPSEYVAEDVDVIIDGALDQFCIEAYEDGRVSVNLGPREAFPNRVTLTTSHSKQNTDFTDGLFDHYRERERQGPLQNRAKLFS